MIDIERILGQWTDAETENTTLIPSASPQALRRVHEEEFDDEETIQDILGKDYRDPAPAEKPLPGSIERFGRWTNVTIGNNHFCISYLTPVAVYIGGEGMKFTDRDWSPTTSNHIAAWAEEIGLTGPNGEKIPYREIKKKFPRIPQEEITRMFKEQSAKVDWTRHDLKQADKMPMSGVRGYKYVDPEHRVGLRPYTPPEQEI